MAGITVPPLRLTRTFAAPPERVFTAWTQARHVQRWFSPAGSIIPEAEVDARPGGVFAYMMRFEDGSEHWTRGKFLQVTPPLRLVLDLAAHGPDGELMFRCVTEVSFSEAPDGTRVDIVQSFREVDPDIAEAITAHGPDGWGSTLDKLAAALAA
jgi:uncharacterized protein YndB with AHSA1/START domain